VPYPSASWISPLLNWVRVASCACSRTDGSRYVDVDSAEHAHSRFALLSVRVCLNVCLSARLSVFPIGVCVSVCLSVRVFASSCVSVCLCVCCARPSKYALFAHFVAGEVKFLERREVVITIRNVGTSMATYRFVPKLGEAAFSKSWITVSADSVGGLLKVRWQQPRAGRESVFRHQSIHHPQLAAGVGVRQHLPCSSSALRLGA
jgi:hypothetical protein